MNTDSPTSLQDFLQLSQQRVELKLEQILDLSLPSQKLEQAMRYACLGGGKRIRPVLVYGSALAIGAQLDSADDAACAVELIHSYSLAHDDLPVMDDDDLRRGKPSLHRAYDEATAVLAGDALQALAFQVLSADQEQIDPLRQLQRLRLLSEAVGASGMVGGQSLDFEAMNQLTSPQQLETLHRLKTGALIRASVMLGAMSGSSGDGEPEPGELQALSNYASAIGLAFQVQDDILDEISDTSTLGKPQGSDRQLNKATYVTLLGLDGARAKTAELTDLAIAALDGFPGSADRLRELACYIVSRVH